MTLQQLKNRINSLGVTKQQKIEAYQDMRKDLFDKVGKQQMYHSEAELRLEHFKKEADDYFNTEYSSIINQLERIEKSELEVIKSQYEKVTADDVAELNLLASMEVS
ncbi:hypothetical protein IR117_13350, partial [Streptococcus danieliae]|nr:hypothetical protein [Streptococcus danieliae]